MYILCEWLRSNEHVLHHIILSWVKISNHHDIGKDSFNMFRTELFTSATNFDNEFRQGMCIWIIEGPLQLQLHKVIKPTIGKAKHIGYAHRNEITMLFCLLMGYQYLYLILSSLHREYASLPLFRFGSWNYGMCFIISSCNKQFPVKLDNRK